MTLATFGLLILAGVGGGLAGSIAGLASLVTYPALLAAGLAPVAANVTNTVGLVFSSVGSISGSRPELADQRPRILRLAGWAVAGGIVGGVALLLTPGAGFEKIVPFLIALASVAILVVRPSTVIVAQLDSNRLRIGTFLVGIYGGYFGAAAGVLLLALLLTCTGDTLPRSNAAKNVLLGMANAVAAISFAVFGPVHWLAVLPLSIGLFIGGRLGPIVVRHSPPTWVRSGIAVAGVGLAIDLGIRAYR